MKLNKVLAIILFSSMAVGCSSDDSTEAAATFSGSCSLASDDETNLCLQYTALTSEAIESAETSCADAVEGFVGTWSTEACSSTSSVGTCTSSSNLSEVYYDSIFTAETAEEDCEGTWKAALR